MLFDRRTRRTAANMIFVATCSIATLIALAALGLIMASLLQQGLGGLNADIFTRSTPAPGSQGGLLNAIVGSLLMCALAMVIAVVVGLLAGTWLAEFGGDTPYGHVVRFLNDVLLSAPSILVGLFVYELIVRPLHGFSGLGETGKERRAPSGTKTELLEEPAGPRQAVAAEPSEQLLCAMRREREPDDQTKNEQTEIHRIPSTRFVARNACGAQWAPERRRALASRAFLR